jgi:Flagellar basal body rod FlgEFG protein C-terminal
MNPINMAMDGMARAEALIERSANRIAQAPTSLDGGGDSISLSDEMVNLMIGQNAYAMNLQMLKAGAELQRKLIDILA